MGQTIPALPPNTVAHSITSSARASSVGGMVRPRALAVFILMASSNFCRMLNRHVSRVGPLQHFINVGRRATPEIGTVRGVAEKAPSLRVFSRSEHRRESVLQREFRDPRRGSHEKENSALVPPVRGH